MLTFFSSIGVIVIQDTWIYNAAYTTSHKNLWCHTKCAVDILFVRNTASVSVPRWLDGCSIILDLSKCSGALDSDIDRDYVDGLTTAKYMCAFASAQTEFEIVCRIMRL